MGNRSGSGKESNQKDNAFDRKKDTEKQKPVIPENAGYPWRIEQWHEDLTEVEKVKLKKFHEELIKHNKVSGVISPKVLPLVDALYFSDSIVASRLIAGSTKIDEIFDFGTGVGFPGLIFAILNPKTKVKLVEMDPKRVEFLKSIMTICDIKNAEILNRTIESLPEKSVRYAMTRGVTVIPKLLLMCRKQVVMGGKVFHLKGEEWATEIASIPTQLCSFWTPGLVGEYRLHVSEVRFAVVKTDKISD